MTLSFSQDKAAKAVIMSQVEVSVHRSAVSLSPESALPHCCRWIETTFDELRVLGYLPVTSYSISSPISSIPSSMYMNEPASADIGSVPKESSQRVMGTDLPFNAS